MDLATTDGQRHIPSVSYRQSNADSIRRLAARIGGYPIYNMGALPPQSHVARRRGQYGRTRSRRRWIDRTFAALMEPERVVIDFLHECVFAGEDACRAIRAYALAEETAP